MMSGGRMMSTNAMSPTADVDFAFAPMQQQPPYVGFDAGGGMAMPGVERPLLQHHHASSSIAYDNFDFADAGFPFQEPSALLQPACSVLPPPPPSMAMSMSMSMAMPPPLQMPLLTLPGVPTTAEVYGAFGGAGGSSFLKREDGGGALVDAGGGGVGGGRIGLNLGRRTYFSPADVLAVDRLLTRSRLGGGGGMGMAGMGLGMAGVLGLGLGAGHHHHQPPRCQAEGCKADLSAAKHYHRRHKVCEYHAKAASVAAAGKQQRFCQQCSRFHVLAEFDEAKRSCRKRLTEHNRRRRKPAGAQGKDTSPPPPKKADTCVTFTSSYNSDHKSRASTTTAGKSTAISPNGSGVSCLLDAVMDNGQASSGVAAAMAAPTALSLAALPPLQREKDGGLDSLLMMQQATAGGRDDDDDDGDDEHHRHFMTALVMQAAQQQHAGDGGHGSILSCSSVSDHHQQNGGGNGFFEVDFI